MVWIIQYGLQKQRKNLFPIHQENLEILKNGEKIEPAKDFNTWNGNIKVQSLETQQHL